jgi:hypothetical protein
MASRLEAAANVAVILACTIFGAHYASDLYTKTHRAAPASAYKAGDIVGDTPQLGLKQAKMTLVLVTRSGCHFCSASMPFYRRLVKVAQESGVRLVGATSEDPEANRSYLASNDIRADAVISADDNHIMASGTPTLILVRNNGQVVNSWVGQLKEARENEVLETINGGSK